jgi:hypothetical protein
VANYIILGRDGEGSTIVSAAIDSIDQEGAVVDEMDIVNAVRAAVAGGTGVVQVIARRYQQTITEV